MTCGKPVLVEASDGSRHVRACTLPAHRVDDRHLMRFRGVDIPWPHGLVRVRVQTPATVERQPALV